MNALCGYLFRVDTLVIPLSLIHMAVDCGAFKMISVQLMSHEKQILASFIIMSKENQVDTYAALSGLPETSGPLLIAMKQVFTMINNSEVIS